MAAISSSVVFRWLAAGDAGDLDAFDELLHPDAVVHAPAGLSTTSADEEKGVWRDALAAIPDLRHDVQEVVVDGEVEMARVVVTGALTASFGGVEGTGSSFRIDQAVITHLRDGKVVEAWEIADVAALRAQVAGDRRAALAAEGFEALQMRLTDAVALNRPGATVEHVLVVLPSFGGAESLLSHYAERLSALEHRYLVASLLLHRIEACEMVFLTSQAPSSEVLDYYLALLPASSRASVKSRFRVLEVPDPSARSVAAKLLDRPDLLDELRASFGDRPAYIEPWNVTENEVRIAEKLEVPMNGSDLDLWPLGFKSAGRRLFRDAGVQVPWGREDVRTIDVAAALVELRTARPAALGAMVKLDNSGAGDGILYIDLSDDPDEQTIRERATRLPQWFKKELAAGGVVEERIRGREFASPSVQLDISPEGDVSVLSTHEQLLGGDVGQVYMGCEFPAAAAYAGKLAVHGAVIAEALAAKGVIGRVAADFVAIREEDGWALFALEVNLRKGGTTHPFTVLRNLVPGHYDADAGLWRTEQGEDRCYSSTDNLVDEAWIGLAPRAVIDAVASAGLQFDHRTGIGVVLHMLSCLAVDGRCGLTAVARTADEARALMEATARAIKDLSSAVRG